MTACRKPAPTYKRGVLLSGWTWCGTDGWLCRDCQEVSRGLV